jgi:hypothetical protein
MVVPALASAQRGGGSSSGGGGFGGGKKGADPNWNDIKGGSGGIDLSNKDVENTSPVKLLIDKRKDLKLSDDQLGKIKDIESKTKDKVSPLYRALDSLRKETKIPPGKETDDDRARAQAAKREVNGVVKEIRDSYDAAFKEALPLLDDGQQKTANELADKQKEEAQNMLREKLGMGGRRG